jgi:type IV secretion system protein TrbG
VKSKKLVYVSAIAALFVFAIIIFIERRARAAQVEPSTSPVSHTPSGEVGALPDATYGEALETPNHQRQRLAAEAAKSAGGASSDQPPVDDELRVAEDSPAKSVDQESLPAPSRKKNKKTQAHKKLVTETSLSQSATARDAVEVSDRWKGIRDTPVEGRDGRVVFVDGAGLPTVVCAPLRMCIVELQTGEKLTGEPQIGDSVRWNVEPASYGTGEEVTPMIILKPKAVGLDTNLVITTNRRSYYFRLISTSQDYVAKVSFDYPDDERIRWSAALAKQDKATKDAAFEKDLTTLAPKVEDLNVDYRVKGDKSIRPIRVLDDGVHTYIQMDPAILHREAPILAVIGPDGKAELVNYRVQGNVYIVDRLFDRARLILGSGRKARKADITSGSVKVHRLFARDPFRNLPNGNDTKQGQLQ